MDSATKAQPRRFIIPDGGEPISLTISCVPGEADIRRASLTVEHNASDDPATHFLTCRGFPSGAQYANALGPDTGDLAINPGDAVGAPDGRMATVAGRRGGSLVLDMGVGEEGAGDLIVYYGGLTSDLKTTVEFLRADGSLICKGQFDASPSYVAARVRYTGLPTPYRYVRLRGVLSSNYQVDAVEALGINVP